MENIERHRIIVLNVTRNILGVIEQYSHYPFYLYAFNLVYQGSNE